MVVASRSSIPGLSDLLSRHPNVELRNEIVPELSFAQGAWQRQVHVGNPSLEVAGLIELMDNNPMVCADAVGVPGPVATIMLIALGPLARAGLLLEDPVMAVNRELLAEPLTEWLATAGERREIILSVEPIETGSVLVATCLVVLAPLNGVELLGLYDEAYARSVFVRRMQGSHWDHRDVEGQPHAHYRVTHQGDEQGSFVKIQVMADLQGKCGAAQLVHAMNVMAGFEESLPFEPEKSLL